MTDTKTAAAGTEPGKGKTQGAAPFTLINYVLFAVGLLDIVIGWFLLRGGHITLAPIMLILGYCVLVPMAIIFRRNKSTDE